MGCPVPRIVSRCLRPALALLLGVAAWAPRPVAAQAPARRTGATGAPVAVEPLTRDVLAQLVAVNTTVSTGSSTRAAQAMAARFRAAGWPAADITLTGAGPKSQNLVVRWRGRTRGKPVVFNAHLDVVEAPRLDWGSDPFVLTERDGYLYGRGVLDDKGPAAAIVAAMLVARRDGVVPERDVLLTLTAGEESGVENGVEWLLTQHSAVADAAYVLNLDSGGAELTNGGVRAFTVQAAEKVYVDFDLVASGPGGHSSVPDGETPVDRLARAVTRLTGATFPVRLNDVTRLFLERTGPLTAGPLGAAMTALARDPDDAGAQALLLRDPALAARLRTTCVTTMLRAGTAPNAIPQEAVGTVNCRMLPGEGQEVVRRRLRELVADSAVEVRVVSPATESGPSVVTAHVQELVRAALGSRYAATPIIPYMETGATDAIFFRNRGIDVFGVTGSFVPETDGMRMHGRDERIAVTALREMAQYTDRLLRAVAKTP